MRGVEGLGIKHHRTDLVTYGRFAVLTTFCGIVTDHSRFLTQRPTHLRNKRHLPRRQCITLVHLLHTELKLLLPSPNTLEPTHRAVEHVDQKEEKNIYYNHEALLAAVLTGSTWSSVELVEELG